MNDELKLYHGKPDDERIPRETAVYDLLDKLGISYDRVDHSAAATMEDCQQAGRLLGVRICKNLFLCNRQKTSFYLLLMPEDKEFHTKDITSQINSSRLSFASAEYMEELLGVTPGSATVMGLMNDKADRVQLLIDEDVLKEEYFGCHPCINTTSIGFKTDDFINKLLPELGHKPIIVKL